MTNISIIINSVVSINASFACSIIIILTIAIIGTVTLILNLSLIGASICLCSRASWHVARSTIINTTIITAIDVISSSNSSSITSTSGSSISRFARFTRSDIISGITTIITSTTIRRISTATNRNSIARCISSRSSSSGSSSSRSRKRRGDVSRCMREDKGLRLGVGCIVEDGMRLQGERRCEDMWVGECNGSSMRRRRQRR